MTMTPMARVWLDGQMLDAPEATVSVADRGFTSGDGVFEAIKVVGGEPFALTRHLARLTSSATLIGVKLPDGDELRVAVAETIAANILRCGDRARVRITVTAGIGAPGPLRGDGPPTVVVTADPAPPHPPSARVITVAWPRNERALLVGAKTTSYAENLAILERARAAGAHEALIPDTQGRLCEGTTSNVLIALDGRLVTPSLATGCLAGVTRQLVLEWGLAIEADLAIEELARAGEVLLSSSTRDLLPVFSLDGRTLPAPGPLSSAAIAEFASLASSNPDP